MGTAAAHTSPPHTNLLNFRLQLQCLLLSGVLVSENLAQM
jgi:hypothetical protein